MEAEAVGSVNIRSNLLGPPSIGRFLEACAKHWVSLDECVESMLEPGYIEGGLDRQELALIEAVSVVPVGAVVEEQVLDWRQLKFVISLLFMLRGTIPHLSVFCLYERG
jgi:hypothetical protein